jgi:hypothetical protein
MGKHFPVRRFCSSFKQTIFEPFSESITLSISNDILNGQVVIDLILIQITGKGMSNIPFINAILKITQRQSLN